MYDGLGLKLRLRRARCHGPGVPWCPTGDVLGKHPPHDFGLGLDNGAFTAFAGHWRITVCQPATGKPFPYPAGLAAAHMHG